MHIDSHTNLREGVWEKQEFQQNVMKTLAPQNMHHFLELKCLTFETLSHASLAFRNLLFTFSGLKMTKFSGLKKKEIISLAHLRFIHKRKILLAKCISHLPYPIKESIRQQHIVRGVWRRVTSHLSQHHMNTHQSLQLSDVGDVL